MEHIIINGDLYVKLTPTIVRKNISIKKEETEETNIAELLTKELDPDRLRYVLENIDKLLDGLVQKGEIKQEKYEDYEENVGFYKIFVENNIFSLIGQCKNNAITFNVTSNMNFDNCENMCDFLQQTQLPNSNVVTQYEKLEELQEDFIRLHDFIKKSTFVGRYLEPTKIELPRCKLLYEFLDTYILEDITTQEYTVISKHHSFLKNYKLGNTFDESYDKTKLYQDIFIQMYKNNNGYSK